MSRRKKMIPGESRGRSIEFWNLRRVRGEDRTGHDTFWGGYAGYFSDPDEYLWEIAWGAFSFLPDGSLDIP